MDLMISTYDEHVVPLLKASGSDGSVGSFEKYKDQVEEMMSVVRDQREKLAKEVEKWCKERGA